MRKVWLSAVWLAGLMGLCLSPACADVDPLFVGQWQTFDPERGNSPVEITISEDGHYRAVTRDLVHKTTDTADGDFKTEKGHWTLKLTTGKVTAGLYELSAGLLTVQTEVTDRPRSRGILGSLADRLRQHQKGRLVTTFWKHPGTGPTASTGVNSSVINPPVINPPTPSDGSPVKDNRSNRSAPGEETSRKTNAGTGGAPSHAANDTGRSAPASKNGGSGFVTRSADNITEGMEYFWMHEYGLAFPSLLAAAKKGDAMAAMMVGRIYLKGEGTPQNTEQAAYWVRYSAEHGDPDGQMAYAQMYERGMGVAQSPQEALAWYRKAAAQNYALAEYNLAALLNKQGDQAEYQTYLNRAAAHNLGRARQTLRFLSASPATLSAYQAGVRAINAANFSQAAVYFQQAAKSGLPDAKTNLGWMYEFGKGVPQNSATAAEYYRQAANEGEDNAQSDLGAMYEEGKGIAKNEAQAARWYEKSAAQNNDKGIFRLGRAYDFGIGEPQSREKAIALYDRAGRLGNFQAAYFAHWLRDPTNLDFRTGADRDAYVHKMMVDMANAHAKVFARYSMAKTWDNQHPDLNPDGNPYRH